MKNEATGKNMWLLKETSAHWYSIKALTKHRACLDITLLVLEKCIIHDKDGVTGKYFQVSMHTTVITFKQHVTLRLAVNATANSTLRYTHD